MTGPIAASRDEVPAYIPTDGDVLFGVLTYPTVEPVGCAVVHLAGGGVASTGHNRETVTLCRELAGLGYHSMRFDYHGVAESTGVAEHFRLDQPFVADVAGVLKWMEGTRVVDQFALVGTCFGARTALSAAARIQSVRLAFLTSPPVRDFGMGAAGRRASSMAIQVTGLDFAKKAFRFRTVKRLFNRKQRKRYARMARAKVGAVSARTRDRKPDYWVSSAFLEDLSALIERRVPTLLLYGRVDQFWREFGRAREGRLGQLLEAAGDLVDVQTIPGSVHDGKDLASQAAIRDMVSEWLARQRPLPLSESESRSEVGPQLV